MDNLPIDIHTGKLTDWLISRRHINRNWSNDILNIRKKINNAIKDMPEHEELRELLAGTYINYWHCIRIVSILEETEADTKNLFGFYSSQRMKDWKEIIKLYEKENVYLGEAAQSIMRAVSYDIPGLKRSIIKIQQLQEDCSRKETEYIKNEKTFKEQYKANCLQMGISGNQIKQELVALLKDLPDIFDKVAKSTQQLQEACDFYKDFVSFMLGKSVDGEILPLLRYVIKNGNTTTYQWVHGEKPLSIEEPKLDIQIYEPVSAESEELDFSCLDADTGGIECVDIDWSEGGDIAWGDEMEVVQKDDAACGVAKSTEALTVLDNPDTRTQFIDNLYELDGFLSQRLHDHKENEGFQLHSIPTSLQLSRDDIQAMRNHIKATLAFIEDVKAKHLMNIKSNPQYVHRLAETVQKKLQSAEKMKLAISIIQEKRGDAEVQETAIHPKLHRMIEVTKKLQTQVEGDISKRYKDRPVHLMAGVQTA